MFLFGSTLTKKLFPDFRDPQDVDWVVFDKEKVQDSIQGKVEYHYLPCSPKREMTADELYTLKVSHAIRDIHWSKTMKDIRFFQIKRCNIIPSFLNELRSFWDETKGTQKRTDFNVEPSKFFSDNIKRTIPHDDLHKLLVNPPSYLKILREGSFAPHQDLFYSLKPEEQNDIIFEETFVIALERMSKFEALKAYHLAQRALVTRMHPVWVADEVILNWNKTFWSAKNSHLYPQYKKLRAINQ